MGKENWAVLIAGLSFAVSICGFVWSIFKEFIFVKPKMRVSFHSYLIFGDGLEGRALGINVANAGPGHVLINNCIVRLPAKQFLGRQGWGVLPNPSASATNLVPISFPVRMGPGDVRTFYFPVTGDGFLSAAVTKVGVSDTYGRNHFASNSSVRRAREDWHKAIRDTQIAAS